MEIICVVGGVAITEMFVLAVFFCLFLSVSVRSNFSWPGRGGAMNEAVLLVFLSISASLLTP
jgi:hypothetical protein